MNNATTTQEKIAIMQHYVDGGDVEVQLNHLGDWLWHKGKLESPYWNWVSNSYRVKVQPPEVGSVEWAQMMYDEGHKVRSIRFMYSNYMHKDGNFQMGWEVGPSEWAEKWTKDSEWELFIEPPRQLGWYLVEMEIAGVPCVKFWDGQHYRNSDLSDAGVWGRGGVVKTHFKMVKEKS